MERHMNLWPLLSPLIKPITDLIDQRVEDRDLAAKLKHDLTQQLIAKQNVELETAAKVLVAEAQSESWITQSWRPITMLTFTGLVVARWLGLTVDIPMEIEKELWQVIQLGIGGYVLGRSAEKVVREYNGH